MSIKSFINEVDEIVGRYEFKQAALLPILHLVQEKEGIITPEAEKEVAAHLGLPPVHVHEVISFYHLFRTKPQGKCHFVVCQTTACSLLGGEDIIDHIKTRLNIKAGETSSDGKFSLAVVECLGACEIAPMMQCNKEFKGFLNKKKIDELIDQNSR